MGVGSGRGKGATICFRCVDKTNPTNQGFAQIGPLIMEPAVSEGVRQALDVDSPGGVFEVSMPARPGETMTLEFTATTVDVFGVNNTVKDVLFSSQYVEGVAVIIDAATPTGLDVVAFNVPTSLALDESGESSKGGNRSRGKKGKK